MLLAPYDFKEDAPIIIWYRGDCKAGLAIEDRDLLAEADNREAAEDCAAELIFALYPPVRAGGALLVNTLAN